MSHTPEPIGETLSRNWGWIAGAGALLIAMGVLAILAPFFASVAIGMWIGFPFLIAGIGQVVQAMRDGGWKESLGHMLIGAVYVIGGLLAIFDPLAGLFAFSLIVVVMLAISGAVRLAQGLRMRPARGWGWMAASGAVGLAAALIIYASFPGAALWLLGLLAGISFVMDGTTLLGLGLAARRAGRG